ncbi:hypothetical protein EV421DRAFT_810747 [Armillaria borealis]|uniref:F-box domain-containing protein n=1 Tax=Armillaria borealis TaxID=47425 RepID=A0AA39MNF3_9AGAR|nr:hypothetical protein EV421DRAFT_810747 [Armillaria borealis]
MDTLPQELVDAIVDILADDRRSLCALCSVSRSLRSQARVRFLRSARLWTERSVLAFHDSCTLSPEIPNLVQNLSVTLGVLRGGSNLRVPNAAAAKLRTSLEEQLLSHPLPNVQALRLELGCAYDDYISDIPTPLLSCPLTSLTLKARFVYSSHLPDFLRHYPALRYLDVSNTSICYMIQEEEVDQGVVLSIEDLSISSYILPLCLDKQLFAIHALRSIKLASFQLTELHECQWLLENPDGALQRLHIHQPLHQDYRPIPKLEMLHVPYLTLEARRNDKFAVMSVKWFIDCLESGQGPVNTSRINILLTPSGKLDGSFFERSVDEHIWTSLDSTMTAPRFAATTLCIWVGYTSFWYPRKPDADLLEITQRFICNALPGLRSANRLEVHCKVLRYSFDEVMHLIG